MQQSGVARCLDIQAVSPSTSQLQNCVLLFLSGDVASLSMDIFPSRDRCYQIVEYHSYYSGIFDSLEGHTFFWDRTLAIRARAQCMMHHYHQRSALDFLEPIYSLLGDQFPLLEQYSNCTNHCVLARRSLKYCCLQNLILFMSGAFKHQLCHQRLFKNPVEYSSRIAVSCSLRIAVSCSLRAPVSCSLCLYLRLLWFFTSWVSKSCADYCRRLLLILTLAASLLTGYDSLWGKHSLLQAVVKLNMDGLVILFGGSYWAVLRYFWIILMGYMILDW